MKIFKAAYNYEAWLPQVLDILEDDLACRAQVLERDPFI